MHHSPHCYLVRKLYKRALRTNFDYTALDRRLYRQVSIIIRQRFEAHRNERDPVKLQGLLDFTETLLTDLKHSEPAIRKQITSSLITIILYSLLAPYEPGGTAYQTDYVPPADVRFQAFKFIIIFV